VLGSDRRSDATRLFFDRFRSATVPQSLDGAYAAVVVTPVLTCAVTE